VEDGNLNGTTKGVPQGGLLSPLLSNIYLHELDMFMESKIESLSSKEKLISKVNPKMA
jgi:RNA-directed DNA polymerase